LFASQVKTLLCSGRVPISLSNDGIASFLAFGTVTEPLTAVTGVYALAPGHLATLSGGVLTSRPYWTLPNPDESLSRQTAISELREFVVRSVKSHLVSDVPLGIFLSGGIDSSIIAAVASAEKAQLTTLSVDFDEVAYSEAQYIRIMTELLAGDHTVVKFRSENLADMRAAAFAAMDQPSADGVNTYVVSRAAASRGLKVALSGLGADELFDGYGHVGRVRKLETALRLSSRMAQVGRLVPARFKPGGDKLDAWLTGEGGRGRSYEFVKRVLIDADVRRLLRQPPVCRRSCGRHDSGGAKSEPGLRRGGKRRRAAYARSALCAAQFRHQVHERRWR
jgi:asparagine synthetase B (glutamine-hydrolysing)